MDNNHRLGGGGGGGGGGGASSIHRHPRRVLEPGPRSRARLKPMSPSSGGSWYQQPNSTTGGAVYPLNPKIPSVRFANYLRRFGIRRLQVNY